MALIGYARVSARDARTEVQTGALRAAGCTTVYLDHAHGALDALPQLTTALQDLREGDTLVVTRLDRLARSVTDLKKITDQLQARHVQLRAIDQDIDTTTPDGQSFLRHLAVIADFQHDRKVENTHDGLATARARGRKGGRKPKMTPDMIIQARAMYDTHPTSLSAPSPRPSVSPAPRSTATSLPTPTAPAGPAPEARTLRQRRSPDAPLSGDRSTPDTTKDHSHKAAGFTYTLRDLP